MIKVEFIHDFFTHYVELKKVAQEKKKLKRIIKTLESDMFVRDSVIKQKKKEKKELDEKGYPIPQSQLKMITHMNRGDWTGNEQDKTAYSFYKSYIMIVKKIESFNINTKLLEILRYFNFLVNICITYDMTHLLPKWQARIDKRKSI